MVVQVWYLWCCMILSFLWPDFKCEDIVCHAQYEQSYIQASTWDSIFLALCFLSRCCHSFWKRVFLYPWFSRQSWKSSHLVFSSQWLRLVDGLLDCVVKILDCLEIIPLVPEFDAVVGMDLCHRQGKGYFSCGKFGCHSVASENLIDVLVPICWILFTEFIQCRF